jgi:hypothetical protein
VSQGGGKIALLHGQAATRSRLSSDFSQIILFRGDCTRPVRSARRPGHRRPAIKQDINPDSGVASFTDLAVVTACDGYTLQATNAAVAYPF